MGLKVANNADEIPDGAKIFIRAHGESLNVIESLKARNIEVVDMTCPFVKKAQDMAAELSQKDYHVVLLGDKNHPEIKGIKGHCKSEDSVQVIAGAGEIENINQHQKIALISQTTQQEKNLSEVAGLLVKKCFELHVCNTICRATTERQNAVRELVKNNVDGVILIGGKASANTAKLQDIILKSGKPVLWVEDVKELREKISWLDEIAKTACCQNLIGIAAGASTPEWLIIDIINVVDAVTRGFDS